MLKIDIQWPTIKSLMLKIEPAILKPGPVVCAVILATGTVDIECLRW